MSKTTLELMKERGASEYAMELHAVIEKFNNEWPEDEREPMHFSTSMMNLLFNQKINGPIGFNCAACGHEEGLLFEDMQDPVNEFLGGLVLKITAKCPKCGEQTFLWERAMCGSCKEFLRQKEETP